MSLRTGDQVCALEPRPSELGRIMRVVAVKMNGDVICEFRNFNGERVSLRFFEDELVKAE